MNKNFFLAMAACIAFLILWNQLGAYLGIVKTKKVEEEPFPEPAIETVEPENVDRTSPEEESAKAAQEESLPETPAVERQRVTLANSQIEIVLDNEGAIVKSATLKTFFESTKNEHPIRLVSPTRHFPGEVVLADGRGTRHLRFTVEQPKPEQVIFRYQSEALNIVKTYTLMDDFRLDCKIELAGRDSGSFHMVIGEGLQPILPGDRLKPSIWDLGAINPKITEVAWSEDGDHESEYLKKPDTQSFQPQLKNPEIVDWAGIKDNYFANVFLPSQPQTNLYVKGTDLYIRGMDKPAQLPVVSFRAENEIAGFFYLGPMRQDLLAKHNPRLKSLITYGWAGLLSKWLFLALDKCHAVTGNWGWAIIILTFFIRIALIPLTLPSMKSSYKMKKLQPKMDKLKQKYSGSDLETKQKLSQETFKLYKEEGVNPFSSCITALAQMPVFIAYFSLLRSSIYLRQADWLFWIDDLSVKDPTYVLPIVMGATMFLTTLTMPMPAGADPAQQKIMKLMPVFFSVMFIGMPAGLIIYMITSNLFSLVQTKVLKWRYENQ